MSSLGKIRYFFTIIYRNGGLWKSLWKLGRFDTLKDGRNVGCDAFGNQYFENNYYFIGRSRWVEYNKSVKLEYDATQEPMLAIESSTELIRNHASLLPL
ncbi:PREDICTED: probable NADH dehydrogenase [ubiquinone] 1 alpha subcomplex subunit 12 isoform X3 [Papilio polytes]|uniref:probable NADH dehydrogenase [ubiquinone] 1 alpha subcomplex subunit 12 isoform X3 n=1 Tax=Papilio polytes TaxID=76194 RepID=UPI00067682B8|nr:PREDICTED: probable NADH dehydrogenase [ubiquinone] 1 alpha subcomplex subunit 12 isoform X3 [Papilio polytes]